VVSRVPTTDRVTSSSAADRFAAALAAVILAAGAAMLVFLTVRFAAVASSSSYSPWHVLGIPSDRGGRISLLVIALVVSLLVLAAGLRHRDPLLRFERDQGTVLVRAGALEDAIRAQVFADADVLRVSPRVRLRGKKVTVEVEVVVRPRAERRRLQELTERGARAAITQGAGLPDVTPRVDVDVVSARKVWMYL
jgi:hypothetical protein